MKNVRTYRIPSGYTGSILEEEVLGSCRVEWSGYMKFRTAMQFARENQPSHLPPCALRLRQAVLREMKIPEDFELKLFTSVGTPLDKFHGIDGWFEFNGFTVTFDLTMRPNKTAHKARVTVFLKHPDEVDLSYPAKDIAFEFHLAERMAKPRTKQGVLK